MQDVLRGKHAELQASADGGVVAAYVGAAGAAAVVVVAAAVDAAADEREDTGSAVAAAEGLRLPAAAGKRGRRPTVQGAVSVAVVGEGSCSGTL